MIAQCQISMTVSKFYPTPLTPTKGSKVNYLNFAITKAIVNIFCLNFASAGRAAIDIKLDFSLKAWVQAPGMDLGGGAEAKIKLFQNMVMLRIKLKLTTFAATWLQIFCPLLHPWPRGWGQKVKQYIFVKVVMLHIKLKGIEHRAPWKQICCHYTHQRPLGWGQKVI